MATRDWVEEAAAKFQVAFEITKGLFVDQLPEAAQSLLQLASFGGCLHRWHAK
jgi:hypothetical protein